MYGLGKGSGPGNTTSNNLSLDLWLVAKPVTTVHYGAKAVVITALKFLFLNVSASLDSVPAPLKYGGENIRYIETSSVR